jgi:hypothetical protein
MSLRVLIQGWGVKYIRINKGKYGSVQKQSIQVDKVDAAYQRTLHAHTIKNKYVEHHSNQMAFLEAVMVLQEATS